MDQNKLTNSEYNQIKRNRKVAIEKRKFKKKFSFVRRGLKDNKKLDDRWRRPRGLHNKQRLQRKGREIKVKVGYGTNKKYRGVHPSGYCEKLVCCEKDLDSVDPLQGIRFSSKLGARKKEKLVKICILKNYKMFNK